MSPHIFQQYSSHRRLVIGAGSAVIAAIVGTTVVTTAMAAPTSAPSPSATPSSTSSAAKTPTRSTRLSHDADSLIGTVTKDYPQVTERIPGRRRAEGPGRVVDLVIPDAKTTAGKAEGDKIADYLKDNQASLHIRSIAWHGQIWTLRKDSSGWRAEPQPGSTASSAKKPSAARITRIDNARDRTIRVTVA